MQSLCLRQRKFFLKKYVILGAGPFPKDLLRIAALFHSQHEFMTWYGETPTEGNEKDPPPLLRQMNLSNSPRTATALAHDLRHRVEQCAQRKPRADCVVGEWAHDTLFLSTDITRLLEPIANVKIVYVQPVLPAQVIDNFLVWARAVHLPLKKILNLPDSAFRELPTSWTPQGRKVYEILLRYEQSYRDLFSVLMAGLSRPFCFTFAMSHISDDIYFLTFFKELLGQNISKISIPTQTRLRWTNRAVIWHRPHGVTEDLDFMFQGRKLAPYLLYGLGSKGSEEDDDESLVHNSSGSQLTNITFVTFNTNPNQKSLAEKYWELQAFPNTKVLGHTQNITQWDSWILKPWLVQQFLLSSSPPTTPYLIITDGFDNFMAGDFSDLVDKFESYHGVDVLLCNTQANWPNAPDAELHENNHNKPSQFHSHGSAGAMMVRTSTLSGYLAEIIAAEQRRELWTTVTGDAHHYVFDDQLTWRRLQLKYHPRIQVDYQALIFSRYDERIDDW